MDDRSGDFGRARTPRRPPEAAFLPRRAGDLAPRRRRRRPPASQSSAYPGDFVGVPAFEYAPRADSKPDPGEIVWTWVPFEEDFDRGKDRPVLAVGRDRHWLLALMLSSQHHEDGDATEIAAGRHWIDIGAGDWDPERRPSEVRLDRVLRIDPQAVRREGATLPPLVFAQVALAAKRVAQDRFGERPRLQ